MSPILAGIGTLVLGLSLVPAASSGPLPGSGLVSRRVPGAIQPEWRHADFSRFQPRAVIKVRGQGAKAENTWLVPAAGERSDTDFWLLRYPNWTPAVLNSVGKPAPLTYDPQLKGRYDIILNMRAVDPVSAIGIRFADEEAVDVVRTAETTKALHYDQDVPWRTDQVLDDRSLVIETVGERVYLQGITFVPSNEGVQTRRVATDHVTVARRKGRHFAFPGITRLPGGQLAVVYRDGVAHVCPFGQIALVRSGDNGRTWGPPETVVDTPSDERDPSIHTLPDGNTLVTFNTWNSWMSTPSLKEKYAEQSARIGRDGFNTYTGRLLVLSSDGGKTWGERRSLPAFSPHGPVVLPSGELFYISSRTVKPRRLIQLWQNSPEAETWTRWAVVAESEWEPSTDQRVPVFGEPHLAALPNGTWLASLRVNSDGYVRQCRSTDGGRTWTKPKRLGVRGFPQHVLPLRDGRLLMTYGYRYQPYGVRAVLSRDNGVTWDLADEIILRMGAPSWDLGYPVSLELDDGLVLTVYYTNDASGDCFIEGAFYRP